ncbi:hypothetical protein A9P82_06540 [Arachidicoccus ginsenosidimutans]|uniref:hypothetical protein n=1 Tax=Arachidicoccus sp. BS20 TaxID=1850526 RepID=UPI0007F06111|nr:hypothetical protein [Arachidicoccus sp. BS20]ANI88981.1 hypothetical protein A9P82_06540 [Arachidicoccus sp. BS20]
MRPQRDLIIYTRSETIDMEAIEREVRHINAILYFVEGMDVFCRTNEVIDINRYKVVTAPYIIHKTLADKRDEPFVFIFNKN